MQRQPRTYKGKRSASECNLDAMFVKMLYRRKADTARARRKRSVLDLEDLPSKESSHNLRSNSNSPALVVNGKYSPSDPFDRLFLEHRQKQQSTRTRRRTDYDDTGSSMLNNENQHNGEEAEKSPPELSVDDSSTCSELEFSRIVGSAKRKVARISADSDLRNVSQEVDVHIKKVHKNLYNLGKTAVCSTPVAQNRTLKRQEVLTPIRVHDSASNSLLEQSVQTIHEWSYIAPETTAYEAPVVKTPSPQSDAKHVVQVRRALSPSALLRKSSYNHLFADHRLRSDQEAHTMVARMSADDVERVRVEICNRRVAAVSLPLQPNSDTDIVVVDDDDDADDDDGDSSAGSVFGLGPEPEPGFVMDSDTSVAVNYKTDMDSSATPRKYSKHVNCRPRRRNGSVRAEDFDSFQESMMQTIQMLNNEREKTEVSLTEDTLDTDRFVSKQRRAKRIIDYPPSIEDVEVEVDEAATCNPEIGHADDDDGSPISSLRVSSSSPSEVEFVAEGVAEERNDTIESPTVFDRKCFPARPKLKGGKAWRRSLSMYIRTDVATGIQNGEVCNCANCTQCNLEKARIGGRNFRYSINPRMHPDKASFAEGYAQNRRREAAALEKLIEDITQLNVTSHEQQQPVVNASPVAEVEVDVEVASQPPAASARDIVLQRCGQTSPQLFSRCFPKSRLQHCHKIGEGVYGEVFLFRKHKTASVMKVIPIEGATLVNGERQKKFEEILSEIIIASELSALRTNAYNTTQGFNLVERVRCVQGKYPSALVEQWEAYEEDKGTENDNPADAFGANQLYVVLELAYAGQDVEAFVFASFAQVYHVFLQVALSLAVAEAELEFEHRDLHWGNVLVSRADVGDVCIFQLEGVRYAVPTAGARATIIDYTLSRITYDNICIYNDLGMDPELFKADGDYQFDIYREMQKNNGNNWEQFMPFSNVLWLHYLLVKMTTSMNFTCKKVSAKDKGFLRMLVEWENVLLSYKSAKEFVQSAVVTSLGDMKESTKAKNH